jgi:hypothetical protein
MRRPSQSSCIRHAEEAFNFFSGYEPLEELSKIVNPQISAKYRTATVERNFRGTFEIAVFCNRRKFQKRAYSFSLASQDNSPRAIYIFLPSCVKIW